MDWATAFYIFILIGLASIPWTADAVFMDVDKRKAVSTSRVLMGLIAGVMVSLFLMGLGIYHGNHLLVVYLFLLPTAFAVYTLKVGYSERKKST